MARALFLSALLSLFSIVSRAGECPGDAPGCGFSRCATPATAVPRDLWGSGELRPVDGALPRSRDTTGFDEFTQRYSLAHPQWFGLDIRAPYLYALAAWGLQVWSLEAPEAPRLVSQIDGPSTLRAWSNNPEVKQPLRWISVSGSTAAVAGVADLGVSLFDLTAPAAPRLLYQDAGFSAETVAATSAGGRTLVLAPALDGVHLYDATAASPLSRCLEGADPCGAVRLSVFGRRSAAYVSALGSLAAVSHGSTPGLEVYDLADPLHPRLLFEAAPGEAVGGVALFEASGGRYLGYRSGAGLVLARVLDRGLETVVFVPLADGGSLHFLTASTSSAGPVLYLGSDNRCGGGLQREWVFDVSDPGNPRDLTPDPVAGEGYWGWYYRGNRSGFNNLMPRTGKFLGEYFYRAALSILDVHRRVGAGPAPPRASFTVEPAAPRVGQSVTFRSTSAGAPEGVEWWAPGGEPQAGSGSPFVSVFSTAGEKEVGLTACNRAGCDSVSRTIPVSAEGGGGARPVADFRLEPGSPRVGEAILLTDTSSGSPSSWAWSFPGGSPERDERPATSTSYRLPGWKSISLQVCNGAGCAHLTRTLFVRAEPPVIDAATVEPNPVAVGEVARFRAAARGDGPLRYVWTVGSTSWEGAGGTWAPPAGSPPVWAVRLAVSGPGGSASTNLTLRVTGAPDRPKADFTITPASPYAGERVTFTDTSVPKATRWSWELPAGNSSPGIGPEVSTLYPTPGFRSVKLTACNEVGCGTLTRALQVLSAGPAIIRLTASPNPGRVGQAIEFSASATGRPPLRYSWRLGGQTYEGPSFRWTPPAGSPSAQRVEVTVTGPGGRASASLALQVEGSPGVVFSDVPAGHPAAGAIGLLVRRGLLRACAPGRFCPDEPATRREIAELLARLSRSRPPRPARGLFADLPRSEPGAAWIEELYRGRRIEACGEAPLRFCPEGAMLRGNVPAWFLRVLEGAGYLPPRARGLFSDLPASSPVAPWVEAAYGLHLFEPCASPPLRFCSRLRLSRGELARWLVAAFRLV